MGFAATLTYIAVALLQPWAGYPEVASLRPMYWLLAIVIFVTVGQVVFARISLWVPQIPVLGVFIMLTVLSMAATGWMGGAAIAFFMVMVPLVACSALIGNADTLSRLRWLSWTLVVVAVFLSLRVVLAFSFGIGLDTYALVEIVGGDDGTPSARLYRARALGFLADPNDLAQYLVACLSLATLFWRRGRMVGNVFLVVVPICLMGSAIYLTRSRGGLVGLAFLVTLAGMRVSKLVAPLAGIAVLAGMLGTGFSGGRASILSTTGTAASRVDLWADALTIARAHPILGVGYGNIADYMDLTVHNTYLLCLVETGVPGLFFWLAAFSFTFLQLRPMLSDTQISDDARRSCRLAMASLASTMVTSFFLSRTYALTMYIFLGTAVAAFLLARKEQKEPQPLFRFTWLLWNGLAMCAVVGVTYAFVRMRGE
jgi:O-antigen ligase